MPDLVRRQWQNYLVHSLQVSYLQQNKEKRDSGLSFFLSGGEVMSFFNKVSNIWKSMGFKESDKMKKFREQYNIACAKEKTLEHDLVEKKREKTYLKACYQHECPHLGLFKSKGGSSINDYYARCSHCKAEVYDHAGCINYLNNLIDLLNKSPKLVEAYKIYLEDYDKQVHKDTGYLFMTLQDMIRQLTLVRNDIANIKSSDFNGALKKNIVEKEEGNSNETH